MVDTRDRTDEKRWKQNLTSMARQQNGHTESITKQDTNLNPMPIANALILKPKKKKKIKNPNRLIKYQQVF